MPKKTFSIDDFSGGINTYESPQNIAPNELVSCKGFKAEPGVVSVLGDFKGTYSPGTSGTAANDGEAAANAIDLEPGYGLAAISHDYDRSSTPALVSTNYMILQDKTFFDWHSSTNEAWTSGDYINSMGANLSGSPFAGKVRPCFFTADGALRVSTGNFKMEDSGGQMSTGDGAVTAVRGAYQKITVASTIGDHIYPGDTCIIGNQEAVITRRNNPNELWFQRNVTGNFPGVLTASADIYVIPETRWMGLCKRRCFPNLTTNATFNNWVTTHSTPQPPIERHDDIDAESSDPNIQPFHTSLFAPGETMTNNGTNAPLVGIAYLNTTTDNDATWDGMKINFHITALYDDIRQESQPRKIGSDITIAAANMLGMGVAVDYADGSSAADYLINSRVVGARVYFEDQAEPGTLYQLLEIDFEKGVKKPIAQEFKIWQEKTANRSASCPTTNSNAANNLDDDTNAFIFKHPPKVITYEINTGYRAETTIHARYKTAIVLNRRVFIGNIMQNGIINGDRMIGSPVNKFDIFPETNSIDVTVGDGDQIVKLEGFADRILQFKKRTLYVINVGGGPGQEFLEGNHKGMGIQNPSQSCMTEYGVAWVNSRGVYHYDGKQITDLTRNKLKLTDSTRGRGLNIDEDKIPTIGFHPDKKWLIIHVASNDTGSYDQEAWIFDFKNGSWAFSALFSHNGEEKTNMVWTGDNELIHATAVSGGNTPAIQLYRDPAGLNVTVASNNLEFITKNFDLELPGVQKTLKSVYITYSAGGNTNIEADIIYIDSSGSSTVALIEEKGSSSTYYHEDTGFKTTSGAIRTVKLTPTSAVKKAYSFQLKLHNPDATHNYNTEFKLYSIAFTYRIMVPK